MKICSNCKATLQDNACFCPSCGLPVQPVAEQPGFAKQQQAPYQAYNNPVQTPAMAASKRTNGGMLAWSIICIVLGAFISLPACILGIVATVKTCGAAKSDFPSEEQAMLKTAQTLNIAATIIMAVMLLLTIIAFVLFSGIIFAILEEMTYY